MSSTWQQCGTAHKIVAFKIIRNKSPNIEIIVTNCVAHLVFAVQNVHLFPQHMDIYQQKG
jgi:hypothetical protein